MLLSCKSAFSFWWMQKGKQLEDVIFVTSILSCCEAVKLERRGVFKSDTGCARN